MNAGFKPVVPSSAVWSMKLIIGLIIIISSLSLRAQNVVNLDSIRTAYQVSNTDAQKFENLNLLIRNYLQISMDSTKVYNDKLLKLARNTSVDSISIQAYNLASTYYFYNSQMDSCLLLVEKTLDLLKDSDDHRLVSDTYRKLAILSRINIDFDNYEAYSKLALEEAKKSGNWELIASSLVVLGNVHFQKNDYSRALEYYLKVDSTHNANNGITSNLSLAYENISLIYSELKSKQTLEYLDKSISVHRELGNKAGENNSLRLKGNYQNKQGNFEKAIQYYEQVLPFYESFKDPNKLAEVYSELVLAHTNLLQFDSAESYLNKGLAIVAPEDFSRVGKNEMYYAAGYFYLKNKNFEQAVFYLNEAQAFAPSKGTDYYLRERKEISEALKDAYKGLGNYEKAFQISERLLILKDSLELMNKEKITTEIEAKYQTEKKEQQIAILKSQNELAEQKRKSQRNLLMSGIGLTSMVGLFMFLLYRNRQKTNKKLRELDTIKSNFFANISHELRTPLTLIKGPLESQMDNEKLSEKDKQILLIAKNHTERLETLVDQLLDLSKLESGFYALNLSFGDLSTFLRTIATSFTYQAAQKKQQFHIHIGKDDKDLLYDPDIIQKIVSNLLSNALKYSPQGATINLNASISNKLLLLSIKNTGVSLSKEQRVQIFNRFHRSHQETTGTGIGLALTKELVELHKGNISVESKSNSVLFEIRLPVGKSAFQTDELSERSQGQIMTKIPALTPNVDNQNLTSAENKMDSERPIVLIVDDHLDILTYVSTIFSDDFEILTAENGLLGFEMALKYVPDIVITDLMMPEDDGLALTENCKTHDTTSHIPIIMLTAKSGDENRLEGLVTGADAYLTKPFNPKILKQTVNNLLESRKKLQERFSKEVILTPKEISIDSYDERFLNTLQEILNNQLVESDFNASAFADILGMSRMQLHRKLKALTGQTATEFIRSQRVKLAAELLKKSDANISEIGYTVGFNNPSHFTKCFKEQFGIAPSEFRA
ncbi:helix-turn-helix domain-containing protein [Croceiramulus getboli]|nr:response regulator [Flavobacteriaceae bacterium YJPT1-3]